jgi:hypothetical protein
MGKEKVKNCLMCGSAVKLRKLQEKYYIVCYVCSMTTGSRENREELIKQWNLKPREEQKWDHVDTEP